MSAPVRVVAGKGRRERGLSRHPVPAWLFSATDLPPIGYLERRRRAKLRRRARDRDVAILPSGPGGQEPRWNIRDAESRDLALNFTEDGARWWSTAEGRRAWLEADRDRKHHRRERLPPWTGGGW